MYAFRKYIYVAVLSVQVLAASGYATNGILDLRYESFDAPVPMSGQWEFYWKRIIKPYELFTGGELVYLPSLWKDQIIGGDTLTSFGYATYRLKVLLPENPMDYQLFIDDMYTSYELYVDGKLVAANGKVGATKEASEAQWLPMVVNLPKLKSASEIVLHISNWEHSRGGITNDIYIGINDQLSGQFNKSKWLHISLFTLFVAISLFFMIRFAFYSYDLASFYFGLFALCYGYRIVGADLYVLNQLIPDFPWIVGIHLEYLSLFTSTIFFALYVNRLHSVLIRQSFLKVLLAINLLFALITLIFPPSVFTQLVIPFFVMVIFFINYGFYIYTIAAVNSTPGSTYGVLSVAIVFAIFIYQIFYYFGWLSYLYEVSFMGHLIFLVLQSIQLYKHSEFKRRQVVELTGTV